MATAALLSLGQEEVWRFFGFGMVPMKHYNEALYVQYLGPFCGLVT